ncbi:MAG: hypothetical protein WC384_19395 [Prolixibacteraceae bacterium]|jgi:hypothetical protein
MKTLVKQLSIIAFISFMSLNSCKKDDPIVTPDPDPVEVLTAKAGPDQTTDVQQAILLDGSSSASSMNKPFAYSWQFTKKPVGSMATIQNNTTAKPGFTPDMVGEYDLELTILNASGQSKDVVIINVTASQPLELDESIDVETVLADRVTDPDLPDYFVNKDIRINAQLTVEPGVMIQFKRDTRMDVNDNGAIIAKGTTEKKIKFTGIDQTGASWKGIVIYSNNSGNLFENVEILYSGSTPGLNVKKAALTLFGISHAYISLKNCLISQSGGYGLHAAAGSVLGNFESNSFTNNAEAGILLESANVPKLDKLSTFTGNGKNVVEILQSNLDNTSHSEEVWAGFNDGTPYRLSGDLFVKTGWKLEPGVIVEAENQVTIEVHSTGYLNAVGTTDKHIVFTGATKANAFWKGIRSYSTSSGNKIEYGEIRYAGSSDIVSGRKANLAITGSLSSMSIKNSIISNGGGYGISVGYGSSINNDAETVNTFEDNLFGNIKKD